MKLEDELQRVLLESADERDLAKRIHKTSKVIVKERFGLLKLCSAYLYQLPTGELRSVGYWPTLSPIIGTVIARSIKEWVIRSDNRLDHDRAITRAIARKELI